jgi:hypothetical protein
MGDEEGRSLDGQLNFGQSELKIGDPGVVDSVGV